MPTSASQSSPLPQPIASAAAPRVFVTPVVRETPRCLVEPASFSSVW